MSNDPWLDGKLEDEGPLPVERLGAIVAAMMILGSVVLRGGLPALMSRWNRGSVGFCLVGLVTILFRDAISGTVGSASSSAGEVSAVAVGRLGWVFLGLALVAEIVFWVLK